MDVDMNQKINIWKTKLLDLGKRNRLIHFRQTLRSTLMLQSPDAKTLWEMLVNANRKLRFPYFNLHKKENENGEISIIKKPVAGDIQADQDTEDMLKTLHNLRGKARIASEEQGIHVLYLAFGFLHWQEPGFSDQPLVSPLILVPVNLKVDSLFSPYILEMSDDEIVLNPALAYKFEHDFGVSLPEFDEEADPQSFIESIADLVRKKNWTVTFDVGLSYFSFLKIAMYYDLEKQRKKISEHPVTKAICGDASDIQPVPEEWNHEDFDRILKPQDTYQIVDADSSQQEAIFCAKNGISFVLQGPPGTGKSQTITNIIAECLADGKRVLFVSEKMAALDVVYKRLKAAALDDFCLVLHNQKTNRHDLMEQLQAALELAGKKAVLSDEAYEHLEALTQDKELLNQYAKQVYAAVPPFGKSIYWVNGLLANVEPYPDVFFDLPNIRSLTFERYNRYLSVLRTLKNVIGQMSRQCGANPWRGTSLSDLTHELRRKIKAEFPQIAGDIQSAAENTASIFHQLDLQMTPSYDHLCAAEEILSIAAVSPTVPISWMHDQDLKAMQKEAEQGAASCTQFDRLVNLLQEQLLILQQNDSSAVISGFESCACTEQAIRFVQEVDNQVAENDTYRAIHDSDLFTVCMQEWNFAAEQAEKIEALQKPILRDFDPDIFTLDYAPMLMRFRTEYQSVFRIFNQHYREDRRQLMAHYQFIGRKLSYSSIYDLLSTLKQIAEIRGHVQSNCPTLQKLFHLDSESRSLQPKLEGIQKALTAYQTWMRIKDLLIQLTGCLKQFEEIAPLFTAHFEFLYTGIHSDWPNMQAAIQWASTLKQVAEAYDVNDSFLFAVCSDAKQIAACKECGEQIASLKQVLNGLFSRLAAWFEDPEAWKKSSLFDVAHRIECCSEQMLLLEEWIDFRHAKEACSREGIGDYAQMVESENLPADAVLPTFQKRLFHLWLDAVLPEYPAVLHFRRSNQERTRAEFSELDRMQFQIAQARIKEKVIDRLPILNKFSNGQDEAEILKREIGKKRSRLSIRKLFLAIPHLLLTLKPCLMMSPLTVSQYLEGDAYHFDTVIFDEASQVKTENAIGAIVRGSQVIIAGDSNQLPPTNFFTTTLTDTGQEYDSSEEEEGGCEDFESVLDEANLLPEKTLLWHYRSRHEHLIAFSNAKIYHNSLITFPSSKDTAPDLGVEYVYVKDGFYARGKKTGNITEAKKVAELVFEHFEHHPERSLGVVAFGEVQQQAIEAQIRICRMQRQEFEPFFSEDQEEAFFIKNLENVQGDERDTIIFSIGYARDEAGIFRMNFGPLSKAGGERRLNVAITRAKYNVKLVGSILPGEIDINRISSDGPKLLQSYIQFAMHGAEALETESPNDNLMQNESPFENAVYRFLEQNGYQLESHVGCSDYRIDLAVKHPHIPGEYVLGIEFDGDAYHAARTARERDRLRQEVLEKMGWHIYHIWSTDWIKDPKAEGAGLIQEIEAAMSMRPDANYAPVSAGDSEPYLVVEENDTAYSENPYGFAPAKVLSSWEPLRTSDGKVDDQACVFRIIQELYPVHFDVICHAFAPMMDNQKVTVRVKERVRQALDGLGKSIREKEDFYVPAKHDPIRPCLNNQRKIEHISTEELAEALYAVLSKHVGFSKDILYAETANVYHFHRMTEHLTAAFDRAFLRLSRARRVKVTNGKVEIRRS